MYAIKVTREQLHHLCCIAAAGVEVSQELTIPYLIASRKLGATHWDREREFTEKDYNALCEVMKLGLEHHDFGKKEMETLNMFLSLQPKDG